MASNAADPETIYNWHRLDSLVTTSGQPDEEQLKDIWALGVRHVVNLGLHTHEKALPDEEQLKDIWALGVRHVVNLGLHTHEKALPDEAASVAVLSMEYFHIPVDFQNPTEVDFKRFCTVLEALKGLPVHVHCIANYRVSAFFYRYRLEVLGMEKKLARVDLEAVWQPQGVWAAFIEIRR